MASRDKLVPETNGHASHHDIFRQIFHPGFQLGFKRIAVWAAVPKKLYDFNLASTCLCGCALF
jgi:hypothetical protein